MALRYVILRHEGIDEPHFDLMFELAEGGPLATWRSGVWPIPRRVRLERLADHRREYLEYEGPISGNRGSVTRVQAGTYEFDANPESNTPDKWSWEFRIQRHGSDGGLLLRRWIDSNAIEHWDATPI